MGSVAGAEGASLFAAGGLCRSGCGGDGEVGTVKVNAFEKSTLKPICFST